MTGELESTHDSPWLRWTSAERIMELHGIGLKSYGGPQQPTSPTGCVDGAVGSAYSAEAYAEGRPHAKAGLEFAAHLLLYLVHRHCFVDGNKRIAWAACVDALAAQGLGVVATTDEAFDFMRSVIDHSVESGHDVAAWLAPRLFAL
jgi:death-on-curing protein